MILGSPQPEKPAHPIALRDWARRLGLANLLQSPPEARSPHPSQLYRTDHPMKQQANLIRAGQVIEHEGRRWTVLKQQIITPGKGGAFIQVEMRDLKSGNKTNE